MGSDLPVHDLHGAVRRLREEHATWNAGLETWDALRHVSLVTFRPDGQVSAREFHNPDGSVVYLSRDFDAGARVIAERSWSAGVTGRTTVYEYDAAGRPTATFDLMPDGERRRVETFDYAGGRQTKTIDLTGGGVNVHCADGCKVAYGAPGAVSATTTHDDRGLPAEMRFHDADGGLVQRLVFTRDAEGRALTEVMFFQGEAPLGVGELPNVPADDRARLLSLMKVAFTDQIFSRLEYSYDRNGRLATRVDRMGKLLEERTVYEYDDRGNRISEVTVTRNRELDVNEDGTPRTTEPGPHNAAHQYEYRYDDRGNWTERVVSSLMGSTGDYRHSNVTRREITYYE